MLGMLFFSAPAPEIIGANSSGQSESPEILGHGLLTKLANQKAGKFSPGFLIGQILNPLALRLFSGFAIGQIPNPGRFDWPSIQGDREKLF